MTRYVSRIDKKMKSLKKNFIYNFIKTFITLIFPVITFAYASRILGVNNFGKVNFAQSFIQYFIMLAMVGINNYGIREAARIRYDKHKLNKFVHEIFIINMLTTVISYIVLWIFLINSNTLAGYTQLILINSMSVILTSMGVEWLYNALEEYRYITLRSIAFQIIALVFMILFVKDSSDYLIYAWIHVFATTGSYILNLFYCFKFIEIKRYRDYHFIRHLKPILLLFAMTVSINLYTALDTTMCGFLAGDRAVGIYSAGVKVNRMVTTLITSLGVVLMPRLSYYLAEGAKEKFQELVNKAYQFIFLLSVPATIGLLALSRHIILVFCSEDYIDAAITMRILMPIVIVIPFSVLTNNQIFIPMYKEKLILLSTCSGAVVNFIANMFLIPKFGENGAAVGTVVAESVVTFICIYNASKVFTIKKIFNNYWQYWISAIPIFFIKDVVCKLFQNDILIILFTIVTGSIVYFSILVLLRNNFLMNEYSIIHNMIKNRRS